MRLFEAERIGKSLFFWIFPLKTKRVFWHFRKTARMKSRTASFVNPCLYAFAERMNASVKDRRNYRLQVEVRMRKRRLSASQMSNEIASKQCCLPRSRTTTMRQAMQDRLFIAERKWRLRGGSKNALATHSNTRKAGLQFLAFLACFVLFHYWMWVLRPSKLNVSSNHWLHHMSNRYYKPIFKIFLDDYP